MDGWPDIQVGGPGFCFPVLRWNGKEYILNRHEYEGKPCEQPTSGISAPQANLQTPSSLPNSVAESTTDSTSWLERNIIYIGIAAALISGVLISGFLSRCPKCGKLFAREEESRDLISRNIEYKTITRTDEHRGSDGSVTGTTKRKEQVAVEVSKHSVNYTCKHCNHRWTDIESSSSPA